MFRMSSGIVVAGLLMSLGLAQERKTFKDNAPLHLAAVAGNLEEVERLLASGAAVDERGEYDWTPLILAANNGHCPVMRALLKAGASPNSQDFTEFTAMHYAADNGYWEAVEILLRGGGDHQIGNNVSSDRAARLMPIIYKELHVRRKGGLRFI